MGVFQWLLGSSTIYSVTNQRYSRGHVTVSLQSQLTLMVVRQGRGLATVSSPTYRYCVDISRYLFSYRYIYVDMYSTPHRGAVPHLLLDV